jgi:hypothetical protein
LARLIKLKSLVLENYTVVWASENPGLASSLAVLRLSEVRLVTHTPRLDLRAQTSLKTLALDDLHDTAVWLPADLRELDLALGHVNDLDVVLWQPNLSNVKRLKLDAALNCLALRLSARLTGIRELYLSLETIKRLSHLVHLGADFWVMLGRLRRLELVWSGSTTKFVDELIGATGAGLRELVVHAVRRQRVLVEVPDRVRQGLELLQLGHEVLIPAMPSLSPPANFLQTQIKEMFQ